MLRQRLLLFVLVPGLLALGLLACSKESPDDPGASAPRKAPPVATAGKPAPAAATATRKPVRTERTNTGKGKALGTLKERVARAFEAAYCAARASRPEAAEKAYADNAFKSPAHFLRAWSHFAEKDAAWAEALTARVESSGCASK